MSPLVYGNMECNFYLLLLPLANLHFLDRDVKFLIEIRFIKLLIPGFEVPLLYWTERSIFKYSLLLYFLQGPSLSMMVTVPV